MYKYNFIIFQYHVLNILSFDHHITIKLIKIDNKE